MMNFFGLVHTYDLQIRLHRRDLHQTLAFCGHVFTIKFLLTNWNLDTWLKTNVVTKCTASFTAFHGSAPLCDDVCFRCNRLDCHFAQNHYDVIKWKHFPRYWPFVRGIHRSPVNSPHKGQWRGASMFSLICTLNKWLNKQSWGWWFETQSRSLWRHCNVHHQNPAATPQESCDTIKIRCTPTDPCLHLLCVW